MNRLLLCCHPPPFSLAFRCDISLFHPYYTIKNICLARGRCLIFAVNPPKFCCTMYIGRLSYIRNFFRRRLKQPLPQFASAPNLATFHYHTRRVPALLLWHGRGKDYPMQRISVMRMLVIASSNPDFNEYEFTKSHLALYEPGSHCCQRCGKLLWSSGITTSYKRLMTWPCNGTPKTDEISIPIFLCGQCGKSENGTGCENGDYYHAILPNNLIPFSQFTLLFILTVLDEYFNHKRTVNQICVNWGITTTTLYSWRKRFRTHYDAWSDVFHSIRNLEESDHSTNHHKPPLAIALMWIMECLDKLVAGFFSRFRFSFMQECTRTHLRELPGKRRPKI